MGNQGTFTKKQGCKTYSFLDFLHISVLISPLETIHIPVDGETHFVALPAVLSPLSDCCGRRNVFAFKLLLI